MSSRRGESPGYMVEARSTFQPVVEIGGRQVTKEWTRLVFDRGVIGVPNNSFALGFDEAGLLSYEAAHSLMAWAAASLLSFSGVEFRLVKHKIIYSYEVTEVGVGVVVNFFAGERAACFSPREPVPPLSVRRHAAEGE